MFRNGLRHIMDTGFFNEIDRYFADFMVDHADNTGEEERFALLLASALISKYTGDGHICLNLSELAGRPLPSDETDDAPDISCPELSRWARLLKATGVVKEPGEFAPLIIDREMRLYLYRYWRYEKELAQAVARRLQSAMNDIGEDQSAVMLECMFPDKGQAIDYQKVAAMNAVKKNLVIISGGPGTGKTYTAAKILGLLTFGSVSSDKDRMIALAAPTGKAAARLKETIRSFKDSYPVPADVQYLFPDDAYTLHRLLGPIRGTKRFRYNKDNLLPYDIVVCDEASMVDLPLMAKLLSALKEDARLILLGDRDQLASVEPGAVFGDLCAAGGDHVVILDKNFRFGEDSGIRALSDMVKEGDAAAAFDLLVSGRYNDIHWKDIPPPQYVREELKERTVKKYADAFTADDPYEAFKPYFEFRVLCALRKGPYGAETVNGLIEKALDSKGLIQRKGMFYKGLPVMVTVNDYQLRLYNGDIGVLLPDIEAGGALRVHFPAESGLFRKVLPARLPLWEKAYAMTVHKSQGSEFDEVLVVLPDRSSEVVTRELIYTAITRARGHVEIWGTRDAFIQAVSRKLARSSGLTDALRGDPFPGRSP